MPGHELRLTVVIPRHQHANNYNNKYSNKYCLLMKWVAVTAYVVSIAIVFPSPYGRHS
jgi:hypothetical protein